jgi:hypothetical protein
MLSKLVVCDASEFPKISPSRSLHLVTRFD